MQTVALRPTQVDTSMTSSLDLALCTDRFSSGFESDHDVHAILLAWVFFFTQYYVRDLFLYQ